MINLLLAILPSVIILVYILKFDKYNPEPPKLLIKLFLYGCLTTIVAYYLEKYVSTLFLDHSSFLYCLIGIGLIEELIKYYATIKIAYYAKAFDEIYDGIIYCVMVSLGFATIENINYVLRYGQETAFIRAITAVPAHTIFACTMGYFVGLSKAKNQKIYTVLSLIIPIFLHGFYDYILMSGYDFMMWVFIIYVFVLYKNTFKLIKSVSSISPFK